jgi:ubiquinone biosynthesis protein UbiJ
MTSFITPFVKPLQLAVNKYLELDPEAGMQLEKMQGKVVELCFSPVAISVFVIIDAGQLDLCDELTGEADTKITGSPISLAMMGVSESSVNSLFSGDVTIEGDIDLGNQFQDFLNDIEVDWEEPVSKLTGDVVANQLGDLARNFAQWSVESAQTNALNTAEYLREEEQLLANKFEVERFKRNVDTLRLDVDRFEAKVNRLLQQQQSTETDSSTNE